MQPSELMAANVSQAFALLVESFFVSWRPQEARRKPWTTLRLQLLVEMCQSRWVWAQGSISTTWDRKGNALCSAYRLRAAPQARVGRWHWYFLSKQHFVLKPHKNKFMGKTHASCYSPTFSQSPKYNFRIPQRSGTLKPFPQRLQIHHTAVVQTQ